MTVNGQRQFEESILSLLSQLNHLTQSSYDQSSGGFQTPKARQSFIQLTERLAIQARDPGENVYYAGTRTAHNSAIRTAISLGIFDAVPPRPSSVTANELVSKTGAETLLIERLMRALVACNIFDQVEAEGDKSCAYTHNKFSMSFVPQNNRDMFQQMYDFLGQGVFYMPNFLENTGWKNPTSYADSAFSKSLGLKEGEGFWEYLSEKPERQACFNSGMASRPKFNVTSIYPFEKELLSSPSEEEQVLLVDVGGGLGQALIDIKETFPRLREKKMVLQDQEVVIQDALLSQQQNNASSSFDSYNIQTSSASFFSPQPVKNARAYYFRRIFHDWPDHISREILANTVSAMGGEISRVLIADVAIPDAGGASWSMALQDWNMMAMGGVERTEGQWENLLTGVGLKVVKVWRADDSNQVVIEARKA